MLTTSKIGKFLITFVLLAFVAAGISSCKSSQYGCPNKITKAETTQEDIS
jgi:hypothetical protein